MALQTNLPSYVEALDMVDKPNTSFKYLKYRKHISLSPKYIGTELSGIKEILNTELASYSNVLDGIPIAFNKPKCVQRHGCIMDENPYMHFDVEVECVMFQPRKGNILVGIVNKLAEDHIGCLVHGKFNASLHKSTYTSGVSDKSWVGNLLNGGDEIEFEVLGLNTRGVVSMYGKFTEKCAHRYRKQHRKSVKRKTNSVDNALPSSYASAVCIMSESGISNSLDSKIGGISPGMDLQKCSPKKTKLDTDGKDSNGNCFTSVLDKNLDTKLNNVKDDVSNISIGLAGFSGKSDDIIDTHDQKKHKKSKKHKKQSVKEEVTCVNNPVIKKEPQLKEEESGILFEATDVAATSCNVLNGVESVKKKHNKKSKNKALDSDSPFKSTLNLSVDSAIKKHKKVKKEKKR